MARKQADAPAAKTRGGARTASRRSRTACCGRTPSLRRSSCRGGAGRGAGERYTGRREAPQDPAFGRLARYAPSARQRDFHEGGAAHRERLFMAGNQLGKTTAGTAETTRDTVQHLLVGRPRGGNLGLLPRRLIEKISSIHTVAGAVDTIMVRHSLAGVSVIACKSYEKGCGKWQDESLDYLWFDEEPPPEIYSEDRIRTAATDGMVFLTFTPLLGLSEVMRRFLEEPLPDRHVTRMTIDDAEHIPPDERARVVLYWAWPADGPRHDRGSGVRLAEHHRMQGLLMLSEHATFEDGSMGVEAGIFEMLERMQTGRWKAFRHLADWCEEFRVYHRRNGRLAKLADDLVSASR